MDDDTFWNIVRIELGDQIGYIPGFIEWESPDIVRFDIASEDATFHFMQKMSRMFGTRLVDIHTEAKNTGGCDTCNFEWQQAYMTIRGITIWPGLDR